MILEYRLDYRSFANVYEKIFLRTLKEHSLKGKILRDHFDLRFYVEAETPEVLENFATAFSQELPHSIFLYSTEASIVEQMPEGEYLPSEREKLALPFCPRCAREVLEYGHPRYFDIFSECEVCGYGTAGEHRSYREEIQEAVMALSVGRSVRVTTHYGSYVLGTLPSENAPESFDLLCYDLATVMKLAEPEEPQIRALASFEKPFLKLRLRPEARTELGVENKDFLRFKLPDDMVLHLLMEELHHLQIDRLYLGDPKLSCDEELELLDPKCFCEPIEVVVSQKHAAILSGDRGLPKFPASERYSAPVSAFYSVIREHRLRGRDVAGIHISREAPSAILVHGEKYGTIEYLPLSFRFDSMDEIFGKIVDSDETGAKLVLNYRKKHPELFERFIGIRFEDPEFNLYRFWGVVSIVLGYDEGRDPGAAAKVLDEQSMAFAGEKGPRIDYRLQREGNKARLDPLPILRSAMSFKLAGVDPLGLSYGVVESFCEFLSNELDQLKQDMGVSATAVSGSMLANPRIFAKLCKEAGNNHKIYFNNQLPVDEGNLPYGGLTL